MQYVLRLDANRKHTAIADVRKPNADGASGVGGTSGHVQNSMYVTILNIKRLDRDLSMGIGFLIYR